jgi:hypothetical protein
MHIEQRSTAPARREAPPTYFVGRRLFEAAEVYAVTADDLERLHSLRRYGAPALDWHGDEAARMELGHALIRRVAEQRPSRELVARFALYVLDRLPDGGFVLDADDVWGWLRLASEPADFLEEESRHSWADRLRILSRRTNHGGTHA